MLFSDRSSKPSPSDHQCPFFVAFCLNSKMGLIRQEILSLQMLIYSYVGFLCCFSKKLPTYKVIQLSNSPFPSFFVSFCLIFFHSKWALFARKTLSLQSLIYSYVGSVVVSPKITNLQSYSITNPPFLSY